VYRAPTTIAQALDLKASLGAAASFLGGGTDLVVGVRKGRRTIDQIIDLGRVEALVGVEVDGEALRIGAMTRLAQLERLDVEALAGACATVGGPQIRNLGTIGGQLGTASPAGDVSVALLALGADVELASARAGLRRIALADFFVGPGRTVLEADELVTAVLVPRGRRSSFLKIGKRDAVAISLVMGAASIGPKGDVEIGLGCVAPTPLRPRRAQAHLAAYGQLDPRVIDEAAALVGEEVSPIDDHRGGAAYRRAMAMTLTRRLLQTLAAGEGGGR